MESKQFCTVMQSPLGSLMLVSNGEALTGLHMTPHPPRRDFIFKQDEILKATKAQLKHYFKGALKHFEVPLQLDEGTAFQQKVWQSLTQIPYGVTWTYQQQAKRLGDAKATRAVGSANGHNPISIIIPCHRVIGSNGALLGYGGGLDRKRKLLRHESKFAGPERFKDSSQLTWW
jgi:methylated-DNA-[protein]-cysteine S-methyltransferase